MVLPSVREAERRVAGSNFMEYLPIGGSKEFVQESIKLAFGEDCSAIKEGRVAAVQSLSGTGSCRLFADFQKRWVVVGRGGDVVVVAGLGGPSHTWHTVFFDALLGCCCMTGAVQGFLDVWDGRAKEWAVGIGRWVVRGHGKAIVMAGCGDARPR